MTSADIVVRYLALNGAQSRSEIARGAGLRLQTVCGAVPRIARRIHSVAKRWDPETCRMVELLDVRRR